MVAAISYSHHKLHTCLVVLLVPNSCPQPKMASSSSDEEAHSVERFGVGFIDFDGVLRSAVRTSMSGHLRLPRR